MAATATSTAAEAFDRRLATKLADSIMFALNECRKAYPSFVFDTWADPSESMPGRVEATVLVEPRRDGPPYGETAIYSSGTPTTEIVMGVHSQCLKLSEAIARDEAARKQERQKAAARKPEHRAGPEASAQAADSCYWICDPPVEIPQPPCSPCVLVDPDEPKAED